MHHPLPSAALFLALSPLLAADSPPASPFQAETVDAKLQIGYGLSIAEMNGDKRPDIVLVDARQTVWYENPTWKKHVLTGSLTKHDHVCVAADDIDADGLADLAVGAGWNPSDTRTSGAVFSLTPGEDRLASWNAHPQHHEPTVHRMQWVLEKPRTSFLAVLPLHGCGNVNTEGDGIRFLGYRPEPDLSSRWPTFLLNDQFHLAHNFDPVSWPDHEGQAILVACKEGVHLLRRSGESWSPTRLTEKGSGEVRLGRGPDGKRFIATVEPFHGNEVVLNPENPEGLWSARRKVLDNDLNQGHALATADFLGLGYDQIAVGWREPSGSDKKVGIRLYAAVDGSWQRHSTVDDNTMACEDMKAADLDGDGRPELIAAGRSTRNLVIYWNRPAAK